MKYKNNNVETNADDIMNDVDIENQFKNIDEQLGYIQFNSKNQVLNAIKLTHNKPSFLARFLNYQISIPLPVAAVFISLCLFTSVVINNKPTIETHTIYVINEGGDYENY